MLDQRLREARDGVKDALIDAVPPTINSRTWSPGRVTAPAIAQRGWPVAVVSAAVVMVLVGLPILLVWVANQGIEVSETTVPTSVPETVTSTTVPVTTTVSPLIDEPAITSFEAWDRVSPQASLGDGDPQNQYFLHAVIAGGPGLIAGGQVRPSSDLSDGEWVADGQAAIWVSEDGVDWDRLPLGEAVFGGTDGSLINDIAAVGSGYVAVGGTVVEGQNNDAAVWRSEDGFSWTRVESPSFEDGRMLAVATSDTGFVAVGSDIWHSSDGVEWQRVGYPNNSAWYPDVDHAPWGFVAVGYVSGDLEIDAATGQTYQPTRPYAWISQNGTAWDRVQLPPTSDGWIGSRAYSVIAHGDGVIAAGNFATKFASYFDMPPMFWTSNDGTTWRDNLVDGGSVPGMSTADAHIYGLASTDSGLVAVGVWSHLPTSPGDAGRWQPAAWISDDGGATWAEVPAGNSFTTDATMEDVAVIDGKLVGVGSESGVGAVWIGTTAK